MAKKTNASNGIVFSTDPNFKPVDDRREEEQTLTPEQQRLVLRLDTKQRAGKAVTLVNGFVGRKEDLEELGKKLRTTCGTGGSVKDGVIIIQGDQREKIKLWLSKNKYHQAPKK
jgi:translation initiation factor 1